MTAERPLRLLFLTEWFDPERAYKGLAFARALADRGFDVEVATGFPNYPGGKLIGGYRLRPYQRETRDGIIVHRLFLWPSHDRSALRRMATYTSFFVSCLIFLLLRMRRYDLVYAYHPPILPAFAAALAGRVWRRRFVMEVQDLWPDSVAASGMAPRALTGVLGALCRHCYRRARLVICQSDGMTRAIVARGAPGHRVRRLYNWSNYAPPSAGEAGDEAPAAFAGRINFVYGGNLGQAQALDLLVDAAVRAAAREPRLHLHLVGDGIERAALAGRIARAAGHCVSLHPPLPPARMDRWFDRADALVIHLKDDPLYDITIPSKTQHYLSVGRPIVGALAGEAARLLEASGAARLARPGDVPALAAVLAEVAAMPASGRAAMGAAGRGFYEREMGFAAAMDRTAQWLRQAHGDTR